MNPDPQQQLNIQRCVDGELSETAQRDFLQCCDVHPEMWRSVALAFLEHRVWDSTLADAPLDGPSRLDGDPPTTNSESADQPARPAKPGKPRNSDPMRLFSIGASLALCLIIGIVVGRRLHVATAEQVPLRAGAAQPRETVEATGQDDRGEVLVLAVDSPDRKYRQTIEVPVMPPTEEARSELMKAPDLVRDDLARHLRAAGYEIRQRRDFVPLGLPDGRRVILPVDNVELHSIDRSDFQ